MGGDIEVKSKQGQGSQFIFHLCLDKVEYITQPRIRFSEKPVLVIDLNVNSGEVVSKQLQLWGLRVELNHVKTEVKLLCDKIKNNTFSVLLIDSNLDISLLEGICDSLADSNKSQVNKTQIILLTPMGNDSESVITSLKVKEQVHTLNKPIIAKKLYQVLTRTYSTETKVPKLVHAKTPVGAEIIAESDNGPVKILLVEDNRINQEVALGLLRKMGLRADLAINGVHALDLLQQRQLSKPYKLVLMDCQMPEMDGYQATIAIRSDDKYQLTSKVNIIAMTANTMKGDQEKCLTVGMNDYLAKPINPSLFAEKIAFWLDKE
jgi:CheY-like chemotaxis protein